MFLKAKDLFPGIIIKSNINIFFPIDKANQKGVSIVIPKKLQKLMTAVTKYYFHKMKYLK